MTTTGRGIVALCLATCYVCTANAYEDAGAVADRIQSAGRGAHLGRDLCGYTAVQVAEYKERLRRSLSAPAEFDTEWAYGWKRAEPMLLQYQSCGSATRRTTNRAFASSARRCAASPGGCPSPLTTVLSRRNRRVAGWSGIASLRHVVPFRVSVLQTCPIVSVLDRICATTMHVCVPRAVRPHHRVCV
jgi:hypothetical protein